MNRHGPAERGRSKGVAKAMAKTTKPSGISDASDTDSVGDACSQAWRISSDLRPLVTSFCARCQGTGPSCIVEQLVEAVEEADETEEMPANTISPGDVRLSGSGPGRA